MIGKNVSRIAIDDNHKVEDIQNLIAIFKGVLEMKN
jgi:hypothetical protein